MNTCLLSQDIQKAYDRLVKIVNTCLPSDTTTKVIDGTGGKVSVRDIIAYQIGWGKCVIRWVEAGERGEMPTMPGDGFSKWDYTAIAQHFYQSYHYKDVDEQMKIFHLVVFHILEIVEREHLANQLDQLGIWDWCTLPSGKKWPLAKWIRVNTVSPYKRAAQLIQNLQIT